MVFEDGVELIEMDKEEQYFEVVGGWIGRYNDRSQRRVSLLSHDDLTQLVPAWLFGSSWNGAALMRAINESGI